VKELLAGYVAAAPDRVGRFVVREYLQARILEGLQRSGAMACLAFHGGTALRFLYEIPRYSEDLDFALELRRDAYDFTGWHERVAGALRDEGYVVVVRVRTGRGAVEKADVRFPGLLYELGLSPHAGEIVSIKVEADTRPPEGAGLEVSTVRRFVTLRLHHHDRASLLAGKTAAVLTRTCTKGRDLYDLMWYLADRSWPAPNLPMLADSLGRSGWEGATPEQDTWRGIVSDRLSSVDWVKARREVTPFLERPLEADLLTLETFEGLLRPPERA
jgi:hypothetical protein